jgi:hypothetical protein
VEEGRGGKGREGKRGEGRKGGKGKFRTPHFLKQSYAPDRCCVHFHFTVSNNPDGPIVKREQ